MSKYDYLLAGVPVEEALQETPVVQSVAANAVTPVRPMPTQRRGGVGAPVMDVRPIRQTERVATVPVETTPPPAPQVQLKPQEPPVPQVQPATPQVQPIAPRDVTPAQLETPTPIIRPEVPAPQASILESALVQETVQEKQKKTSLFSKRRLRKASWYVGGTVTAMFVLALTGYVSIDTWVTNSEVKMAMADKEEKSFKSESLLGEGEDEEAVADTAIDSYVVAPDAPRVLSIDKINVKARVLPMSVNRDGSIQAPININDSGWYTASAKPGQQGASFIDAHASGVTRDGLFAYLDTLVIGDVVTVERGDGEVFKYEVMHTESVHMDAVDMKKALRTYGGASEGLNLMTCAGKWVNDKKTYDQRVIVYTKRIL